MASVAPNHTSFQVSTKLRSSSQPRRFDLGSPTPIVIANAKQSRTDPISHRQCPTARGAKQTTKFSTLPWLLGDKIFRWKQRDIVLMGQSSQHL
jgi:hypothetical protein